MQLARVEMSVARCHFERSAAQPRNPLKKVIAKRYQILSMWRIETLLDDFARRRFF
jgi:hypothetical protein